MQGTHDAGAVRSQTTTFSAGNEVIGKIGNKDVTVDDLMKNIGTKSWQGRQLNKLSAFFTGSNYIGNKDVEKLIQNSNRAQLLTIQKTMDHLLEGLDGTQHPKLERNLTDLRDQVGKKMLTPVFKERIRQLKPDDHIQKLPSQEEIAAEMHRQSKVEAKAQLTAKFTKDPKFKEFYNEMLAHSQNGDFNLYIEKQEALKLKHPNYNETLVQRSFELLDAKYSSITNEYDLNELDVRLLEQAYNEQKKLT